jgi:hypothetical protein
MKKTIVVDGANVAHEIKAKGGKAKTSNLMAMRDELTERGFTPIIIIDATLRHDIDDAPALEAMIERGHVLQAPAGTDADYFVLETAKREDAKIISNDLFRDRRDQLEDLDDRRVPFMIVNAEVQLYEENL